MIQIIVTESFNLPRDIANIIYKKNNNKNKPNIIVPSFWNFLNKYLIKKMKFKTSQYINSFPIKTMLIKGKKCLFYIDV